jgi:Apea-like HEPN
VIHDAFLIMNIAAPGCCNFYRAKLVSEKSTTEISLSSSEFELCVLPSRRRPQTAQFVPIGKVITWYESVRPTVGQIPTSATERTMFALLHLAKLDGEMLSVVWLFYALESLLQTKVGENFGSIVRRLTLLLQLTNNEIPTMKKQMRVLYDLRSAIVHGGFEVIHPMNDETMDERVSSVFGRLLTATEYGLVVLVAAIQKMAEENWPQLRFDEIIVGGSPTATRQ